MCGPGRGHLVQDDGSFECEPCERDTHLVAKVEFTGLELIVLTDALEMLFARTTGQGRETPWVELEGRTEEEYLYALDWATNAVWEEMHRLAKQINEMENK
jgi:hypothetical protein